MKKVLVVITMLFAVLLSSCAAKYDLDDLKIDKDKYSGWHSRELDGWRELDDFSYIDVYYSGRKSGIDQQMKYMVFESSSVAKEYFKKWKKYYYNTDDGESQSGTNWYICREPGTYDMIAYAMYYREENVIIYSEVSLTYYSTENGGTSSVAVSSSEGDQVRKYILENHKELRENVMKMLTD